MAIKKEVTEANGVVTTYHRIALVSIDTNNQVTILVESYLSEEGRQKEKDYAAGLYNNLGPGEMVFPYTESHYINIPYDPDMTIEKAYRSVKSMPNFKDSDDIFDTWSGDGVTYSKGDYVLYNEKIYKVLQQHTSQADWTPDAAVSLFVAIPDPRVDYSDFVQPTGAHNVYNSGDKVTYNGVKYESLIDNNAWSPEAYPAGWSKIETGETSGESGDGQESSNYANFVQPTGAHDAYSKGDKVKYNGNVYESLIDANVWSPDAYPAGWKKI